MSLLDDFFESDDWKGRLNQRIKELLKGLDQEARAD